MERSNVKLMAHQKEGVDFLLSRRSGIVAFEQGLGKSLVAIEAFRRLQGLGVVQTMLILCPNSLKRTWVQEIAHFAPEFDVGVVEKGRVQRRRVFARTGAAVIIVNYESARNEIVAIQALLHRVPAALVLDESHCIKNHYSLNSIAAQNFVPFAEYRWLLTGTPITNRPTDIYPQICVVAGCQPFGSYASFKASYGDSDLSPSRQESLAVKIKPYLIRRTKEECLDLPDKSFTNRMVELPQWQRKLYEAVRDDLAHDIEDMSPEEFHQFVPTGLVRLLRLSQIASNPNLVFPNETRLPGKFVQLDGILDELISEGRKVIVWSYYVRTIRLLEDRYRRHGVASLHGETPPEDRQKIASRFQNDSDLMVLIANPAAAGTGFTLTAANYTIYETLTWRYDQYAQSQDRNHRIGQEIPVTYIRLLAADTIEFAIVEALTQKAKLATGIIGDKKHLSNITRKAFQGMLQTGHLPTQE